MITISEIYSSLAAQVQAATQAAGIDAPIMASDLEEPIVRPSIKIMLDDETTDRDSTHLDMRTVSAQIYYFPPDAHKWRAAHFAMRDALRPYLMDSLFVGSFEIDTVEGIQFTQTDGVLVGDISYEFYEERPSHDDGEPMEELSVGITT